MMCKKCYKTYPTLYSLIQHEAACSARRNSYPLSLPIQSTTQYVPKIVEASPPEICMKVAGAAPVFVNQPYRSTANTPQHSRHIGRTRLGGVSPFERPRYSPLARFQPYSFAHLRSWKRNLRCAMCTGCFQTYDQLQQHKRTCPPWRVEERRQRSAFIEKFLQDEQVTVTKEDKKASKAIVKNVVNTLIQYVWQQNGGWVYIPDVHSAGSNAVGVKIGLADEFDTNIPIQVDVNGIQTSGYLTYTYADKVFRNKGGPSPNNLNAPRDLFRRTLRLPEGQVVVNVNENTTPASLTFNGDLVPFKVLQDFYNKLKESLRIVKFKDVGVYLSNEAHGPALTLILQQQGRHDISVDLTVSLVTPSIPVDAHGWPRPETYEAYSKEKIEEVKSAGVHLVPKGDETWSISYSKAEKALLHNIDAGNGCRKAVLKFLKRHYQIYESRRRNSPVYGNWPSCLSSHTIKTQLLWSIEKHPGDTYWRRDNIDECVLDTSWELNRSLVSGVLPDYFNPSINLLKGKNMLACKFFADYIEDERQKIKKVSGNNPMKNWMSNITRSRFM